MTVPWRRILPFMILTMLAATTLALIFRPVRREGDFHVPSVAEARASGAMFRSALQLSRNGGVPEPMAVAAQRLGLEAKALDGSAGYALAEPEGSCGGRGVYLLRAAPDPVATAITAPHRGADILTGEIALGLFEGHGFAAAAWNSAPRRGDVSCPHSGDVTRLPTHHFTAFSLAFAAIHPKGLVVQLHGFDQARRSTSVAREAGIIVSNGTREPSGRLLDVADCLSRGFPDIAVAVYPIDSQELGATTNAQGQSLRDAGFDGFVHLELSEPLRRRLAANRQDLARLAQCLGARP